MPFSASNSSLSSCSSREFGGYRERYSSRSSTPEREASSRLAAQLERSEYKRSRGKHIRHRNSPRNVQRKASHQDVVKEVLKRGERNRKGQSATRRFDEFWQERSRQKAFPFSSDSLTSRVSTHPEDTSRSPNHNVSDNLQDDIVASRRRLETQNSLDYIRSVLPRDECQLEVYSTAGKSCVTNTTTSSALGNDYLFSRTSLSSRSDGSSDHQGVFSAYDLTQNSPYKSPLPVNRGWFGNTSSLSVNSSLQLTSQNSRDSLLAVDSTPPNLSEITKQNNDGELHSTQTVKNENKYGYYVSRELPYAKHVSTTSYIPHYYSSRFTIKLTNNCDKAEFAQPLELPTVKYLSEMQSGTSPVKEARGFQLTTQGVVQVLRRKNGDVSHTPVHSRTNSLISSGINETSSTSTLKGNQDQWDKQGQAVSVKKIIKRFSGEFDHDIFSDSQSKKTVDKVSWQKVRAESWPKYAQMESASTKEFSPSPPSQNLSLDRELSEDDEKPPPRPLPPESWTLPSSKENTSSYGSTSPFKSPQSPYSPGDSKSQQAEAVVLTGCENTTAFPFPSIQLKDCILESAEIKVQRPTYIDSEHLQSSQTPKQSPRNSDVKQSSSSQESPTLHSSSVEKDGTETNADCRRSSLGLRELIRLHEEQIAQQTRSASMTWFITSFKRSSDKRQNSQESECSVQVFKSSDNNAVGNMHKDASSSDQHIAVEGKPREISSIEIESTTSPPSPNSKKLYTSYTEPFESTARDIEGRIPPQTHPNNDVETVVTIVKDIVEKKTVDAELLQPETLYKKDKQKQRKTKYGRRRKILEKVSNSSTDSDLEVRRGRIGQTPRRRRRKIARQKAVCENDTEKIEDGTAMLNKSADLTENSPDQTLIPSKPIEEEIIIAQTTEITSTGVGKLDKNLNIPSKEVTGSDTVLPIPVKPITKVTTLPVVYTGQTKTIMYPRPYQAVTKAVPIAQVAPVSSPAPAKLESAYPSRECTIGSQSGSAREMYERRLALLNLIPLDVNMQSDGIAKEYDLMTKENFEVKEQQYKHNIEQLKREKDELTERLDQERREWKQQLDDQRKLANAYQKLEDRYRRRVYELQHALLKCQCPASKILRVQNAPSIASSKSLRSSVKSGSGIVLGELEEWLSEQSKRMKSNHKINRDSRDSLISSSSDLTGLGWDDTYDMLALAELDLCNGTHV